MSPIGPLVDVVADPVLLDAHVLGLQSLGSASEVEHLLVARVNELSERAMQLLPPGGLVRHAFICQTAPNFAFLIVNWATGLTMPWITYRCVVITEDAIYVMNGPKLSGGAKPTSVVRVLPRDTKLGPVSGRWGELTLLGERYWVKRRFQSEATAADEEAGFVD